MIAPEDLIELGFKQIRQTPPTFKKVRIGKFIYHGFGNDPAFYPAGKLIRIDAMDTVEKIRWFVNFHEKNL